MLYALDQSLLHIGSNISYLEFKSQIKAFASALLILLVVFGSSTCNGLLVPAARIEMVEDL